MTAAPGVDAIHQLKFGAFFSADWLLSPNRMEKVFPRRWEKLRERLLARVANNQEGGTFEVPRERDITPDEFKQKYFLTGKPVVLAGAAADWPAIKKWSPEYLLQRCGEDKIAVLDAHNWKVSADDQRDVVTTNETTMHIS